MNRYAIGLLTMAAASCGEPAPQSKAPQAPVQAAAISFDGARASGEAKLAHGKRIAAVLGCSGCHGEDLTGEDWSDPEFGTLWTTNLTRAVPRYGDAQLAEVIQGGKRPDRQLWEMPSHLFTQLSDADMAALIGFLRSRPPTGAEHPAPAFKEAARKEIAAGTFKSSSAQVAEEGNAWPPDVGADHALGRYIVRATCAECHGMQLRGGQPFPGAKQRPDLRMVAAYDLAQFTQLMRTGKAVGNRELELMSGVARYRYKPMTDAEIAAVHGYLQKVAEAAP